MRGMDRTRRKKNIPPRWRERQAVQTNRCASSGLMISVFSRLLLLKLRDDVDERGFDEVCAVELEAVERVGGAGGEGAGRLRTARAAPAHLVDGVSLHRTRLHVGYVPVDGRRTLLPHEGRPYLQVAGETVLAGGE